jgi:hypothetical protein
MEGNKKTMNCAKHPEQVAAGCCCSCGRAICEACNVTGPSEKLACSAECAEYNAMHDAAIRSLLAKANRGNKTTGYFAMAGGTIFTVLGVYHVFFDRHLPLIVLCLGLGAALIISGMFLLRNAKTR